MRRDDPESVVDAMLAVLPGLLGVATRSLAEADADLTVAQYRALAVLATTGADNLGGLSKRLGVHPSTATRLCDRLAARRLIARQPSASDRREVVVALTRRGRAVVERVTAYRRSELLRIVELVPPSGRASMSTAFRHLTRAIEAP